MCSWAWLCASDPERLWRPLPTAPAAAGAEGAPMLMAGGSGCNLRCCNELFLGDTAGEGFAEPAGEGPRELVAEPERLAGAEEVAEATPPPGEALGDRCGRGWMRKLGATIIVGPEAAVVVPAPAPRAAAKAAKRSIGGVA